MRIEVLVGVVLLVVLLASLKFLARPSPRVSDALRYKRTDLFNSTEHSFFAALRKAAPPHIAVLAKVRVADLLLPAAKDIGAFNRIARKHVDFVLYNLQSRLVLRAIELDGPTHSGNRAVKSDRVKNSCFASAQIPLTRVSVKSWNDPAVLQSLFQTESRVTRPGLT